MSMRVSTRVLLAVLAISVGLGWWLISMAPLGIDAIIYLAIGVMMLA